jgi:phage gp29-like protein
LTKSVAIILGPNGKPVTRELSLATPTRLPAQPSRGDQAFDDPLFDRYAGHPEYGIKSIGVLTQAFTLAEMGYPQMQCDLFEGLILRDGHLRGALEGRLEAVAGKGWTVAAGGDEQADIDAAAALDDVLRTVPNWQETLEHQLEANWYGWAASEIDWQFDGRLFRPMWFRNVAARRFIFALGDDSPRLWTQANMTSGEALIPGKWWFSRRRGRLTAMAGLMRTAAYWAVIKTWSLRDWMVFCARYGLPYATAQYDETADQVAKDVAKRAIQDIGSDGGAILPKSIELKLHELAAGGGRAGDVHGALADRCDTEISKLVSGATLTSSTSGQSSYALGRVHADVRFELVQADAMRLSHTFQQQVAAPFVAFNFARTDKAGRTVAPKPPQLKIHVVREVDPATRAQVICNLANGLDGFEVDEEQIRQEFQLKRPVGKGLKGSGGKTVAPDKTAGDGAI